MEKFKLSQETITSYLTDVMETPTGSVNENHRLCQEYSRTDGINGSAVRYKMPAKLDAVEKLIKMAGWYVPERVQVGADEELRKSLAKVLAGLRK